MSQVDLIDLFTSKPKTLTWVIEDFENSSTVWSPPINLPSNGHLQLNFRPNEDVAGYKCVILLNWYSPGSVYYRISLINEKGVKFNIQEGRARNEFGGYIFKHNYLLDGANGLLPNGKLTIYCEVLELADAECIESGLNKNNLVSLSRDNQSLLDSGKLSDFVLVVGGREFESSHKLILASRSVVFEKMFEHDLEESKRNRVEITDMSAASCEDLLKFIYTGKVKDLEQHAEELLAAAEKYQIDSLKSYCGLYLALSLSISTIPKILKLAELYSLEELKSKCINYINLHSTEFEFAVWKGLTTHHPELMFREFQLHGNKAK